MASNALQDMYTRPFVWAENDCITAVANYYLSKTGIDYMEECRGKYRTGYEAYRLLIKLGGMEAVLERKGFARIDTKRILTGDIGIVYKKGVGDVMGIIDRGKIVCAGGVTEPVCCIKAAYRLNNVIENRRML